VGFDTSNLLTARVWLPRPNDAANAVYLDPQRRVTFYRETLTRLEALPGVERAAMSNQIPLGGFNRPLLFEGEGIERAGPNALPSIHSFQVSPSYFDTMQIPIVAGRAFTDLDRAGSEPVAIISAGAARSLWGENDTVGKRIRLSPTLPWMTIIGIAGDVRNRWIDEGPQPILYRTLEQSSDLAMSILLRTSGVPTGLGERLSEEVAAVDASLPVSSVRTMEEIISGAVAQRAFLMRILLIFGAAAVGLAVLGIYGVISYSVNQRTREIGIRMAIGARHQDVSRMILRQGLTLTTVGVVAGLVASVGLSRFLTSQLYGVMPTDPLTIGAVLLLMAAVTMLAAYLPARRAARVDPIVALKTE
jgi:predicted permease